jgi:hypothetical protein
MFRSLAGRPIVRRALYTPGMSPAEKHGHIIISITLAAAATITVYDN